MNNMAGSTLTNLSHRFNRSISPKSPQTLVIIDRRVEDLDIIYQALLPGSIGYKIEPHEDAIDRITELLAQTGAKRLAIVAHGESGIVKIGANPLDLAQLENRSALLQEWCVEEISLYSCEVAKGDLGDRFIRRLSAITRANIAASTTKVGASALGGNWNLNVKIGEFAIDKIFQLQILAEYPSVLKAGDLDPSFGTGGKVTIDFDGNSDSAKNVFIQADGKFITVGNSNQKFALSRTNSDGSWD